MSEHNEFLPHFAETNDVLYDSVSTGSVLSDEYASDVDANTGMDFNTNRIQGETWIGRATNRATAPKKNKTFKKPGTRQEGKRGGSRAGHKAHRQNEKANAMEQANNGHAPVFIEKTPAAPAKARGKQKPKYGNFFSALKGTYKKGRGGGAVKGRWSYNWRPWKTKKPDGKWMYKTVKPKDIAKMKIFIWRNELQHLPESTQEEKFAKIAALARWCQKKKGKSRDYYKQHYNEIQKIVRDTPVTNPDSFEYIRNKHIAGYDQKIVEDYRGRKKQHRVQSKAGKESAKAANAGRVNPKEAIAAALRRE